MAKIDLLKEEEKKRLFRSMMQPIISKLAMMRLRGQWLKETQNMSPYERVRYWARFFKEKYREEFFKVAMELSQKYNLPLDYFVNLERKKRKEKNVYVP